MVRVWTVRTGELKVKLDEFRGISITGVSFSPEGDFLAASGKGKVGIWNVQNLKLLTPDSKGDFKTAQVDEKRNYRWLSIPNTESDAIYPGSAITGDGKEVYFVRRYQALSSPGRVLRFDRARDITEEQPGPKNLDARAVACIPDPESGTAAVYATVGEKGEGPAEILLYGLGDTKIITRGVPAISKNTNPRITYSTDGKWLAAYSGTLAVWPVPGSQIIGGEPAVLQNVHAAAIGPKNMLATVAPMDESQTATITLWKLEAQTKRFSFFGGHLMKGAIEIKKVNAIETTLKDVSCLAFSRNGSILAVGGTTDGVVQLWKMAE
jgi:WD40 repeat protein